MGSQYQYLLIGVESCRRRKTRKTESLGVEQDSNPERIGAMLTVTVRGQSMGIYLVWFCFRAFVSLPCRPPRFDTNAFDSAARFMCQCALSVFGGFRDFSRQTKYVLEAILI